MRAPLGGFTTRGKSFLAAGVTVAALGAALGERALLSIGIAVLVLPLFAALATGRARYRIRCLRKITPTRVPAGQHATVSLRLENISRLPTGLLLAEDTVPYPLGTRPRFVLERIEQGGARELSYPIQSSSRGRFTVGPLRVRVADAFGLVELGHSFAEHSVLVVTPAITALPRTALAGSWHGEGQRPDPHGGHRRRRRRGAARLPGRRRAAEGALAFHRPARRTDGAPRGTALAQPRRPAPGHAGQRTRRNRARLVLRIRGQRGGFDRRAPDPGRP